MSEEIINDHSRRIVDLKLRDVLIKEQQKRLKNFITTQSTVASGDAEINAEEELKSRLYYHLKSREEYSMVGHLNTVYSRLYMAQQQRRPMKIYCRIVHPDRMTESFRQHWLQESLLIMRFIRHQQQQQQQQAQMNEQRLHRLLSIVHHADDDRYYLFMERISLSTSLSHVICNHNDANDESPFRLTNVILKQWLLQLCLIIESLNVSGIAHRFIRPENILVNLSGNHRILVTGFDMACFFHSYETDQPILQPKRALPNDAIEDYLLDHLPPECFLDHYDACNVDVWSIGTIICLLKTGNNPFSPNVNNGNVNSCYGDDYNHLNIWRSCWERRTMTEEWRTLLDDIFQESDYRMTVFDLKSDQRLLPHADLSMLKTKKPYYRIDLKKVSDINVNEKEIKKTGAVLSKIQLAYPEFAAATRSIFTTQSHQQIENEQQLFQEKHFRIERNQSFTEEFNAFINDYYLRSSYRLEDIDSWETGLVKIFSMNHLPNRHKNILLNESGKIMKYLSGQMMKQEKECSISIVTNHIHRLIEIFRTTTTERSHLFLFYESLFGNRSLANIFSSTECRSIWPSIIQIKQLLLQLLDVIDYLSRHAISHRYIRPEYIYVDNHYTNMKLGHFEMACFVWNPLDRRPTLRHRGLQDEREHVWNHLPPECFNIKYDSFMVDVWSFGTVLLYCLVQKNPFNVPHSDQQAEISWSTFKQQQKHSSSLYIPTVLLTILNLIFQPSDARIKITDLKRRFSSLNLMVTTDRKKKSPSLISSLSTAAATSLNSNISKLSRISRWKP
ncbi:hypothetical protein BLA29_002201, partial [Euroglyphus maynei]